MARVTTRDLLDSPGVERVGLADISVEKVRDQVAKLNDDRAVPVRADARDETSLAATMKEWDVVVNSTWYELNLGIMRAAISAGIHYLDLGGLYHMTLKQMALDSQAKDSGVTCVLGLGSSPGVTNLMAAIGGRRLSSISRVKIRVAGATLVPSPGGFNPPYSFRTIIDEACMPAVILRGGRIQDVPGLSMKEEFVLPDPVGKVEGYFTLHSELATLPKSLGKGVSDIDFIVAFSPEFSKGLSLLVDLGLARRDGVETPSGTTVPYDLLTTLVDALPRPQKVPADVGIRRVEIWGVENGAPAHLLYDCVSGPHERWGIGGRALGTGVPASLGAQWLASGRVKEKGTLPPESCIEPNQFLKELAENGRGIVTYVEDDRGRRPLWP